MQSDLNWLKKVGYFIITLIIGFGIWIVNDKIDSMKEAAQNQEKLNSQFAEINKSLSQMENNQIRKDAASDVKLNQIIDQLPKLSPAAR